MCDTSRKAKIDGMLEADWPASMLVILVRSREILPMQRESTFETPASGRSEMGDAKLLDSWLQVIVIEHIETAHVDWSFGHGDITQIRQANDDEIK